MVDKSRNEYDRLIEYATKRDVEIRQWLNDYVQVTDDYGRLFCNSRHCSVPDLHQTTTTA